MKKFTLTQAAASLGRGERTVRNMITAGDLQATREGGRLFLTADQVEVARRILMQRSRLAGVPLTGGATC
jgi:excisionase family DNA binding protein